MKKGTTHVVLNDGQTPGLFRVWSEHRSEGDAIKRVASLWKNGIQGRTVSVPVGDLSRYVVE